MEIDLSRTNLVVGLPSGAPLVQQTFSVQGPIGRIKNSRGLGNALIASASSVPMTTAAV